MKGMFPQFDPVRPVDYARIWSEALFVFDTNVLLNLYRYREATRGQMIEVLEALKDRIWIPYYVALEFQQNRLKVIAEQIEIFKNVRDTVFNAHDSLLKDLDRLNLERRHSVIEVDSLVSSLSDILESFDVNLNKKKEHQQGLRDVDLIKNRIEEMFVGRVGKPATGQSELDQIYKQASVRSDKKIPPGYQDRNKGQGEQAEFYHGGLIYQRKHGDYLIWRQLLDFARDSKLKSVILVTDDAKEDWWWEVKSEGQKKLGPRPELIDEAFVEAGITDFLMYRSETFLEQARSFKQANISDGAIQEVREVSRFTEKERSDLSFLYVALPAVERWISSRFTGTVRPSVGFPDFILDNGFQRMGFETRLFTNSKVDVSRVRKLLIRALSVIEEAKLDELYFIFVAPSMEIGLDLLRQSEMWIEFELPRPISLVVGFVLVENEENALFVPLNRPVFLPTDAKGGPAGPPP